MIGIYKYTNLINGQCYIGQAIDLQRRRKDHKTRYCMPSSNEYNSVLHKAFRKYGLENFSYEIIEECLISELDKRETYWIRYYDSYNNGYNCDLGGHNNHFCKFNQKILGSIENDLRNTNLILQEIADKNGCSIGFVSDFNSGKVWHRDDIIYPIRDTKRPSRVCKECGVKITKDSSTGMCIACSSKARRVVERPAKEQLLIDVGTSNFAATGRKYGVTDNTIRKWCKLYGLPTHTQEIKNLYKQTYNI